MSKIFIFNLLFFSLSLQAQIEKMEPPFWWAGMEHSEIQVMFYGKNIAKYEVKLQEEVPITKVVKTENPNYIFVSIKTDGLAAQKLHFNFLQGNKKAFSKVYELKEREKINFQRGYNSSDLIYLLMPDRFANGKSENDAVSQMSEKANRQEQGGRHGGDIAGIKEHLDYLEDLGVTAIWSTPLLEDNDPHYSYHTYAQSDVYHIDPRFGSNEEYKDLASSLHQRGMKLIMDYVTNHWGAEHWMIKDLPTYSWIHQFPGYANSNYKMETQFDTHRSERDFRYCVDGWFTKTMPDLNQSNPLVLNYLTQNAIWWIEYAGLDGFRVDTYSYNDKEGIAKWTKAITDEYPNFNIVGEVWMHSQAQISYWQKDSKIGEIEGFNSHLPSVMDFTLHDAMGSMFKETGGWGQGVQKAYNNFVNDFLYPDIENLLVFMENHDTGRFNEIYDGDIEAYKLGLTLLATTRGIPQIYYGTEIGMRGDKGKGDGDIRRDFPGGWDGDENNAFVESGRNKKQAEFYDFSKNIFNWRKTSEAVHHGKLLQYIPENNVYVYFRIGKDKTIMVVLNNNEDTQSIDIGRFQEGLKGTSSARDILTGKLVSFQNKLEIAGKTPMVLEFTPAEK